MNEAITRLCEEEIDLALADWCQANSLDRIRLRVERKSDGRAFETIYDSTSGSMPDKFPTDSTAKVVMAQVALHEVNEGNLSLDDRLVDVVTSWPASGSQNQILVRDLFSFTSNIVSGPNPWLTAQSWSQYESNSDGLAALNSTSSIPGRDVWYSSYHVGLLLRAAVHAGSHTDGGAAIDAWRTATGLFPSASWTQAYGVRTGEQGFQTTAEDYCEFLRWLRDDSPMQNFAFAWGVPADGPVPSGPTTWGMGDMRMTNLPDYWLSERSSTFGADLRNQKVTVGVGGTVAVVDDEYDYVYVASPPVNSVPAYAGIAAGWDLFLTLETRIQDWSIA